MSDNLTPEASAERDRCAALVLEWVSGWEEILKENPDRQFLWVLVDDVISAELQLWSQIKYDE